MKQSKLFTLNFRDVLRGLAVAAGTAGVDALIENITLPKINWHQVGIAAAAGGLAYLKIKFFTPGNAAKSE